LDHLTTRELQVLKLLAGGASYQEIADSLYITDNTTETHVGHVLQKLHARNGAHAVAIAVTDGHISIRDLLSAVDEGRERP